MGKYKMPTKSNLKGRSSTISNAYAISVTPYIIPTNKEVENSYAALQIQEGQCAYCLGEGTGKDHLKPLVRNGMPTGYTTSIENLVPCCSACNSSKGAKEFRQWYLSSENIRRLKLKGLDDKKIHERYNILSKYEDQIGPPLDYEKLVGKELWEEYKIRRKVLIEKLNEEQAFCDKLGEIILEKLGK
jgi:hypothetical protein